MKMQLITMVFIVSQLSVFFLLVSLASALPARNARHNSPPGSVLCIYRHVDSHGLTMFKCRFCGNPLPLQGNVVWYRDEEEVTQSTSVAVILRDTVQFHHTEDIAEESEWKCALGHHMSRNLPFLGKFCSS